MDLEYDSKFEEMKQYIPFLESMIKRLELTSSTSNPRQAQLDKIRSLRDLLLDKKKRMKMENLLKCEQVLVNLYTKVEQKDTLPGIQKVTESKFPEASISKEKSDFDSVRNKLKTVAKSIREDPDTLPEIARASETEEVCTPGSKEPALFQRRPQKATSPPRTSPKKSPQRPKLKGHFFTRVFTRVLKSPEPSDRRWGSSQSISEKPLFSRRSPRRSPRRFSPTHYKKDRKKSSRPNKSKDLNITLNVPEESLNSLNTEDILSRIINCRDGDVDIDTLRDLRTQILGELKQTGANDDISDLIMKSYKKKKRGKQKKKEVEEGELSDSESEAIDSIYGSLIVVDKDKVASKQSKTPGGKEAQPRKIQICLVINSDKDGSTVDEEKPKDISGVDFEMLEDIERPLKDEVPEKLNEIVCLEKQVDKRQEISQNDKNHCISQEVITIDDDEELKVNESNKPIETVTKHIESTCIDLSDNSLIKKVEAVPKSLPFKPNFYKPLTEEDNSEKPETRTVTVPEKSLVKTKPFTDISRIEAETVTNKSHAKTEPEIDKSQFKTESVTDKKYPVEDPVTSELSKEPSDIPDTKNTTEPNIFICDAEKSLKNSKEPVTKEDEEITTDGAKSPAVEIPLLNEPPIPAPPPKKDVVSEIDILQALKNEILSENITSLGSDTVTPALHQPKLTKVSSSQEIMNKKRISIEKYKQKSTALSRPSLFVRNPKSYNNMSKEDYAKKQSLKLTEKECERFNFSAKLALDESSDEDFTDEYSLDDIYRDLAPESPENDDFADTENLSPVIIPADPVKTPAITTKADIDMRTMPLLSPAAAKLSANNKPISPSVRNERIPEQNKRPLLVDPRVRRENRTIHLESPNPHIMNPERTPRSTNFPNMTPNARTFELNPSRQSVDSDDSSSRKHVYAPIIIGYDPREQRQQCENRDGHSKQVQRPHWEPNTDMNNEGRRSRWESDNRDGNYSRNWDDRNSRGSDSRNWDDRNTRNSDPRSSTEYLKSRYDSDKYQRGSRNDRYIHDKREDFSYRQDCPPTPSHCFGRSDCPATPTPSFGRLETPTTPVHAFGRSDCPTTPSHPFGRSDCSPTPSHPFGRTECPTTPSHPFGRSECPLTPTHPFGRSDMGIAPMTPSHPFGRSEYPHNSLNNVSKYVKDPRLNRIDSSDSNSHNFNDDRDRVYYKDRGKSDIHDIHYNTSDSQRGYNREQSDGRDRNKPYEQSGRSYNRDQSHYEPSVGRGSKDLETNKLFTRERSRRNDYRAESDYVRDTDDVGSTRNFQRSHSVGRTIPAKETFVPSSSKQGKDETNYSNKLSVKPQTGSSFTIDTSVDKTFQEFLNGKGLQVFDYSFDARRQRASSVGRSLIRESSEVRTVRETSVNKSIPKPIFDNSSLMRKDFVRARSMCRDMADVKTEKSLKDIKADFKNYCVSYKEKETTQRMKAKVQTEAQKKMNYVDPRTRKIVKEKEMNEKSNTVSKTAYSPRKNSRDPRMSRDECESKSQYKIDRRKQHGIVYSNDNIARGTILGSGYGVKNYKIPKIKRAEPEEKPDLSEKIKVSDNKSKEIADKGTEKKTKDALNKSKINEMKEKVDVKEKDKKDSNNTKPNIVCKKQNDNDIRSAAIDDTSKRTRYSKKSGNSEPKLSEEDSVIKRKTRRSVIYDSDSDIVSQEKKDSDIKTSNKTESPKKFASPSKAKKAESTDEALNSSFAMDDLGIFPENMASDPVMANINALIADLDNDIDTSKPEESNSEFTNEINLEKILNSFSSPDRSQDFASDVSLKDISEFITEDLSRSNIKSQEPNIENSKEHITDTKLEEPIVKDKRDIQTNVIVPKSQPDKTENDLVVPNTADNKVSPTIKFDQLGKNAKIFLNKEINISKCTTENEAIDSTTENDTEITTKTIEKLQEDLSAECSLTPDSTINTEIQSSCEKGLPDSTNEVQNEMNSDITSTHVPAESLNKDIAEPHCSKQEVNKVDLIGNLLSMLKDKSKIKEILSMLGDKSSDNEKIKKKLEKLSEIVSDDEDIDDVVDQEKNVENDLHEKDATEQEKPLEMDLTVSDNKKKTINERDEKVESDLQEKDRTSVLDDKKETIIESDFSGEKVAADDKMNATNQNEEWSETGEMSKLEDEDENEETDDASASRIKKPRKRRGRKGKWKAGKKVVRVTRQAANTAKKPKITRELKQLQDDIKEMFISNEVLNSTGIRMCRLAKLMDEKSTNQDEENVMPSKLIKPVVILEKFKEKSAIEDAILTVKINKMKPMPKSKAKVSPTDSTEIENKKEKSKPAPKYKPGPKSKTKPQQEGPDPYLFDPDSVSETNTSKDTENELQNSSESDNDSLSSSKSFGSSEVLAELKKKPKRKRNSWKAGVIKPHKKKKKIIAKPAQASVDDDKPNPKNDDEEEDEKITKKITIPDRNCFTDKNYCFSKGVTIYSCRLCPYGGTDIVHHYKRNHPHSEIPLSRMSPKVAQEAINQCEDINFQAISLLRSEKHVCRFCFKEFSGRGRANNNKLEEFFWHVVSTHTGEYKQLCSECINVTRCPFNLDIPPPPKEVKGQLLGYICGKCNFTQISLENLKTHVIVRHNDEQTAVYTINFAVMTKKTIEALMKRCEKMQNIEQPRILRSGRSNQSMTDVSDTRSEITESTDLNSDLEPVKRRAKKDGIASAVISASKITFDDDKITEKSNADDEAAKVKAEVNENEDGIQDFTDRSDFHDASEPETEGYQRPVSDDIFDCAHFKVCYTDSGIKEYVCCVNGKDNHYKTSLLISMKKHVQHKHSEKWDGYCYVCKLIVTPQGEHRFKECFQHYLDKHIDNFPILGPIVEPTITPESVSESSTATSIERASPKPNYINVRPMADLIAQDIVSLEQPEEIPVALPVIESVVSLGTTTTQQAPSPGPSSIYSEPSSSHGPVQTPVQIPQKTYKYEEAQADVMSKKLTAVLDPMLSIDKLIRIFKCAGRFCSFTSNSAEDALLHASTHQRIGGENALICAYCDFNCAGNAIDLVMHVFKNHGCSQYACRKCFYRASASQLVRAHMLRMHGAEVAKEAVLMTDIVTPVVDDRSELLTREVAVQHYLCQDMETSCTFRTFTQGKFCEHLMRHQPPYLCSECMEGFLTPTELTNHLKTHGLKLYQCTWCVHGADNETELLAHASEKHPIKQPQAYLRIITTKEGTSKMMVLPLAKLNKSNVRVQSVTISGATDNPLRDAERSIELESLIDSMPRTLEVLDTQQPENAPLVVQPSESTSNDDGVLLEETVPRLSTPPPSKTGLQDNLSSQITPVLKTELETLVKETGKNDVICLDSDEEDSRDSGPVAGIIAVSDDEASSKDSNAKAQKINQRLLYKCSICSTVYKTKPVFKRHIQFSSCFPNSSDKIKCAHCPFLAKTRDELYTHYDKHDARVNSNRFVCSMCDFSDKLASVKNHIFTVHGVKNVVVSSRIDDNGVFLYTVSPKPGPKRKLSASKVETPPKKKRYNPQEVDQLPTKPILDELVYCSLCEFNTKVRLNMVRHLQQHAEQQPVAQTVPVNPVPHLESNEKHFDKMVNLASSSIVTRAPDKPARVDNNPTVNLVIPPEAATRFPKYVPERQRYTCGAKGCSYTSLNEGMLKQHWEALHTGTIDFHCVHCPSNQSLDTSMPLIASRIISHLKMHDVRLYACSSCTYYHYKSQVLDIHLAEAHNGSGQVNVVREEAATQPPAISQPTTSAPTMDLKAWQCGLCKFKSMLRQEVIEHCAKVHSTKMQFKCPNCPFRGSNLENVTKHQQNSHPGSTEETFYFYYREGSIPDQLDGTPRWLVQRQKMAIPDSEVKTEIPDNTAQIPTPLPVVQVPPAPVLDLNIVKKEVVEPVDEPIEKLCLRFGQFGEPNGLKYKCPLCKIIEDNKDAMQSHLYEELKYRKWGCSICSYKAFHITGLNDHMSIEHSIRQNQTPMELPPDIRVEKWVTKLLEHQTNAMESTRENLATQSQVGLGTRVEKPSVSKTVNTQDTPTVTTDSDKPRMKELEDAFGQFGEAKDNQFCCPKCEFQNKDESLMRDHLESELNRIRWRCSKCAENYQNYHEAQLHCKSVHVGLAARPMDAARDPALRAAWLDAVLTTQRQSIKIESDSSMRDDPSGLSLENSLLVVRYEERIPTPEAEMLMRRKRPAPTASTSTTADSDDERLVIDEPTDTTITEKQEPKKKIDGKNCPHCDYSSKYKKCLQDHELRHYNLKPFQCNHCNFTCYKQTRKNHHESLHYGKPFSFSKTKVPTGIPVQTHLTQKGRRSKDHSEEIKEDPKVKDDGSKEICLVCEKAMSEIEARSHTHDNIRVQFGKKGEVVVKCCICFALLLNVNSMLDHHTTYHPTQTINYAYFKLHYDSREIHHCGHCDKRFKFLRDLKSHHNATHSSLNLRYVTKPHLPVGDDLECADEKATEKRKTEDSSICPPAKKLAKKSTTKLPSQIVARKSTTKLPNDDSDSEIEESYYGNISPNLNEQSNVTTLIHLDAESLGDRMDEKE